jgi:putative nucleotidyltransferase with HDIG domain
VSEHPLLAKLRTLRELRTLPAVLLPLLRHLEQPLESQDMHKIVQLIAQDKALAARCLQLANSPLYGAPREIESVQAAVLALGLTKIHEIAVSCSLLKLMPTLLFEISPSSFWAHSLACALVSREFAAKIGYADAAKAYAAGLLHDVGIVALLWTAPDDFCRAVRLAQSRRIPLHEAEEQIIGISHVEAGEVLGSSWQLSSELVDAIAHHHEPRHASSNAPLVAIVSISDLLCRSGGIGYGIPEDKQRTSLRNPVSPSCAHSFPRSICLTGLVSPLKWKP